MRLLFHIGAGKTGTSSIQFTLRGGMDALKASGVWYLGLMLEHAPVKRYPWQVFGGTDAFHSLPDADGEAQLQAVLDETVALAREAGVHTLVWSSESFFDRHAKALRPLQRLIDAGIDLRLIAYVRRHDAWARSAYAQWAIKHKTHPGPILPFAQWVQRRPPKFAAVLAEFEQAFPGRLSVRNLDAAGDAVQDFLMHAGLAELGLAPVRENVTPDDTELLMRALFNDGIKERAFPMLFDRVLGRHTRFDTDAAHYMAALLPAAADLAQVKDDCADDRAWLDAALAAQGQPPIDTSALRDKPAAIDESRLLFALAKLNVFLMRRVENLEARLKKMEAEDARTA